MSSLCVAMIVRDEEQMLPDALASLAFLPPHSVRAVDTGSVDRTKQLLTEAGAKVFDFGWVDDFAAARNAALEHADGDWVLVLDADERVTPELGAQVRDLLGRWDAGAATVRMHNVQANGHVREARLLRLFRRDPAVRFRYPIHEDVSESVYAALGRTGQVMVHLDGRVHHLGYQKEYARSRGKKERDQRLLQKHLAAEPDSLYSHFKLLELARFYDDASLGGSAAVTAAAALGRVEASRLRALAFGGELVVLIANALHGGALLEALYYLESFAGRLAPSAAWSLRRAELFEQLGQLDAAAAGFEACRALGSHLGDLQLSTVRPCMGLSRVALARGHVQQALGLVEQAVAMAPQDPEALLAKKLLSTFRSP